MPAASPKHELSQPLAPNEERCREIRLRGSHPVQQPEVPSVLECLLFEKYRQANMLCNDIGPSLDEGRR
jgi:hypothetical protein